MSGRFHITYYVFSRGTALKSDPDSYIGLLRALDAWAVLNGIVREPTVGTHCGSVNCVRCKEAVSASAAIAAACSHLDIPLLTVSSDLVLDGQQWAPYLETMPISPSGACNQLKADRERRSLAAYSSGLVVRTGPLFGWEGQPDLIGQAHRNLADGKLFMADEVRSPTYAPDFAHVALDLLMDGERGIWHVANTGSASWSDLMRHVAKLAVIDPGGHSAKGPHPARALQRLPHRILESERGWLLSALGDALARHVQDLKASRNAIRGVTAA